MDYTINSITKIHQRLWRSNLKVSDATRLAIQITRAWQVEVTQTNSHIIAEYPVEALGERVDLYDERKCTAYELKVSQNNTHMEFYRDVFKVIVHNETSQNKIKKLVFISPKDGIVRLQKGWG